LLMRVLLVILVVTFFSFSLCGSIQPARVSILSEEQKRHAKEEMQRMMPKTISTTKENNSPNSAYTGPKIWTQNVKYLTEKQNEVVHIGVIFIQDEHVDKETFLQEKRQQLESKYGMTNIHSISVSDLWHWLGTIPASIVFKIAEEIPEVQVIDVYKQITAD